MVADAPTRGRGCLLGGEISSARVYYGFVDFPCAPLFVKQHLRGARIITSATGCGFVGSSQAEVLLSDTQAVSSFGRCPRAER